MMQLADDLDRFETIEHVVRDLFFRYGLIASGTLLTCPTMPLTDRDPSYFSKCENTLGYFLLTQLPCILALECPELLSHGKLPARLVIAACRNLLMTLNDKEKKKLAKESYDPDRAFDEEFGPGSNMPIKKHRYSDLIRALRAKRKLPKHDSDGIAHISLAGVNPSRVTPEKLAQLEFRAWLEFALADVGTRLPKLDYFHKRCLRRETLPPLVTRILDASFRPFETTLKNSLSAVKVTSKRQKSETNVAFEKAWAMIFEAHDECKKSGEWRSVEWFYEKRVKLLCANLGLCPAQSTVKNRLAVRATKLRVKNRRQFTRKKSKRMSKHRPS